MLAAMHICSHHKPLKGVVDIDKAMTFLDRPRQARQLRKRVEQMESANPWLLEE
jgi:hypothetical protein